MAEPVIPPRAKLFIGILAGSDEFSQRAEQKLLKKFGDCDLVTMKIPFTHTAYYKTLGKSPYKILFSFSKLIQREDIVKIKLFTNKLEEKLSDKGERRVNIDPGYLTLSNVYLATCKDYFHRTYLSKGIYLENEFKYVARKFETWEWTYPDYRNPEVLNFFYNVRRIYHNQLRGR